MLPIGKRQVKALSALKHLQGLFEEGPQSFTERVMQEIASPKMAGKDSYVEGRASSPLLQEIQETAELLRAEVTHAELICASKRRETVRSGLYTFESAQEENTSFPFFSRSWFADLF